MKNPDFTKEYGILKAGYKYKIIEGFSDYDRYPYEAGEVIEFHGCSFLPYEDGLSLFCTYKGQEKQIRLQVRPEAQQEIVNNLGRYLECLNQKS